jgi:hypothetical protein
VGQTIAFRGPSVAGKGKNVDRRQKTIVCPTDRHIYFSVSSTKANVWKIEFER